MPQIDPTKKKHWVKVLPDIPASFCFRPSAPSIKQGPPPPVEPKPVYASNKRQSPQAQQPNVDDYSRQNRLPSQGDGSFSSVFTFPQITPKPDYDFNRRQPTSAQQPNVDDYSRQNSLPSQGDESFSSVFSSPQIIPKPDYDFKRRQPTSVQQPDPQEQFNYYRQERSSSQWDDTPPQVAPKRGRVFQVRPPTPANMQNQDMRLSYFQKERQPSQGDAIRSDGDFGGRQSMTGLGASGNYFGSDNVQALNTDNFYDSVVGMEKAFVMFYNPSSEDSISPARELTAAADRNKNPKHTYASVDCSANSDLCCREQTGSQLPIFRLFSNGFYVSTIRQSQGYNANRISMMVRMSPVLHSPLPNPNIEGSLK